MPSGHGGLAGKREKGALLLPETEKINHPWRQVAPMKANVARGISYGIMPKTYGNLWPHITSWDNLYAAYVEARRGKRTQGPVLQFGSNLEENLFNIQNHLLWRSWRPSPWREFVVKEPKARLIQAPAFQDRVVHHALVRVIGPLFERKFIHDSYACRKGKGTHAAVLRAQSFLRAAKREWGQVYVLKADISKYFPSIGHARLKSLLARTVRDPEALRLCNLIVDSAEGEFGIPVGALTSQLFANVYMDRFDHLMKDELGVKFYIRYMDDWLVFSSSKEELWRVLNIAENFLLNDLGLRLNPKTAVFPMMRGVDFCGYRIWPTHILPRKRNTVRARRRLRRLADLYARGSVGLEEVGASVMSFLGYMKHCSGHETTKQLLKDLVLTKRSSK